MAKEEVKFGSSAKGLLDHLVNLLGRTKEAIKGRGKNQEYRQLVIKLSIVIGHQICLANYNQYNTQPSEIESITANATTSGNNISHTDPIVEFLKNQAKDLPHELNKYIILICDNGIPELTRRQKIDNWLESGAAALRSKPKNRANQSLLKDPQTLTKSKHKLKAIEYAISRKCLTKILKSYSTES